MAQTLTPTERAFRVRMDRAYAAAIGMPVRHPAGPAVCVGWSGHTDRLPLVRLDRDPPHFGSLVLRDIKARDALLARAGLR